LSFEITSELVACNSLFDLANNLSLRCNRSCGLDAAQAADFTDRNEATRKLRLLQDFLAVQLGHAGVFSVLLQLGVAGANLFFAGVLGDTALVERIVRSRVDVLAVEDEIVAGLLLQADLLATGEDLMTTMLLVPLGERARRS